MARAHAGAVPDRGASRGDNQLKRLAVPAWRVRVPAEPQLENPVQRVNDVGAGLVTGRPWLCAPGTSGTEATTQPSSPSS
jgi:hypothetical protein